jgi:hypothetical protein
MPSSIIPEPWRSFLLEIDSHASEVHYLHCLGGFVVTHHYGSVRTTSDVDFLTLVGNADDLLEYAGFGSGLHKTFGLYLDPVGVANVPENYAQRMTEMYPDAFKHLRLFALDPYDIVLSKIERNIERDRDDVKFLAAAVALDLDILKRRYADELRPYLGIPEREDLTLKLWVEMIEEVRGPNY